MKKWLIGGAIALGALGLVLGGAVYAASTSRAAREVGTAAFRRMGERMRATRPMQDGRMRLAGELHDYVFESLAEALNLSAEDLETRLAGGEALTEIAEAQGVPQDGQQAVLEAAWSSALQAAVEDGVLTQEQADAVKDHPGAARMFGAAWARRGWSDPWPQGPMGPGPLGQ